MQYPITARGGPPDDRTRVLKYGSMFAVFDRYGDVEPWGLAEHGIFFEGTRYLSQLVLHIGGARPLLLSSTVREDNLLLSADLANVDLIGTDDRDIPRGVLLITRLRFLSQASCFEQLEIRNFGLEPVSTFLDISFSADFADIFEVRGTQRPHRGTMLPGRVRASSVTFGYLGLDEIERYTHITFSGTPPELTEQQARLAIALGPHEEQTVGITISCSHDPRPAKLAGFRRALEDRQREDAKDAVGCEIYSSSQQFNVWARRSVSDLEMMLRGNPEGNYPYAGVPWFSTVFGRDGIITALQMLWMHPQVACGVLEYLAATQAVEVDPAADAEPGKIVHETRRGEMAFLREVPFRKYYGSVDATPLFLLLLSKYHARTGDMDLVTKLWPNVLRALAWIDEYGDIDGDGFVEYARKSDHGLIQQGWKDSSDSVFHQDGTLAEAPIALCEVQAYVYAAKKGIGELAQLIGDVSTAQRLEREAESLRTRFWEHFWCPEIGMYALALDGEKKPCQVRTSNAGHCLYTGIAHPEHAASIAKALMSPSFFSGWGIRTVASTEVRYNPVSYHNGSVWPHDNSILAAGLAEYGFKDLCARLFSAFLSVSQFVDLHRLPELFCGIEQRVGESPTLYPVACSPQSWSAGSILLFLQATLGISVDAVQKQLVLERPYLPDTIPQIWIKNLRANGSSVDLFLERSGETVRVHALGRYPDIRIVIH